MIDNLKVQTHMVLCKIQSEIIKMESQECKSDLNPENEFFPIKFKELLDLYCVNLDVKEKAILEITFMNELNKDMSLDGLKECIEKAIVEMNFDGNEFNSKEDLFPKTAISKTLKMKRIAQLKRSEPTVESNPEYFRVDKEVCSKLFDHYKSLQVGLPKNGGLNFEEKEHHKNSMNYHKIIEVFKDAGLNLEINQKLLILRSVKKFCFNQSFINLDEFVKVFKVIVHGLGYKQQIFEDFIRKKNLESEPSSKRTKSTNSKNNRRNYRFKTEIHSNQLLETPIHNFHSNKNVIDYSVFDTQQSRASEKVILEKPIVHHQVRSPHKDAANNSYLVKAIDKQKISKITWDSLFNMKSTSMHSYIQIPEFVRDVNINAI